MATNGKLAQGLATHGPWHKAHAGLESGPRGRIWRNTTAPHSLASAICISASTDHEME